MQDWQFFTGRVISQKPKTDRQGRAYWGVTVKVDTDILVWFGQDAPITGPDGGAGMTVTGAGRVNGTSDDGCMTFMRDVRLGDGAADVLRLAVEADDDGSRTCGPEFNPPAPAPATNGLTDATTDFPTGTFTVVFDSGDYRTIKVQTVKERGNQFDGWTFAKFLDGPDNDSDYRNFAFARPGQTMALKRGFQPDSEIAKALRAVLTADPDARHAMGVAYARQSGNCYVCNRTLTTPESIEAGIGPVCAGRE